MKARSIMRTLCLTLWLFGFAFLRSAPAFASPAYPPAIQTQLSLAQPPDCTLCHRDLAGGVGTVVRLFGRTMVDRFGLVGGSNVVALKAAIEGDDTERVDSDGDGVPDIDELRAGTNPNVGTSGVEVSDVPLPQTGCAFSWRAPAAPGAALILALLLVAMRFARARRSFEYPPPFNSKLSLEHRE